MLERIRFEREIEALREAEPEREYDIPVTKGEFGNALAEFALVGHVPNAVTWFLTKSPTYSSIIKDLDDKYLHLDKWRRATDPGEFNDDGLLITGPNSGRRLISVVWGSNGSNFQPWPHPGSNLTGDVIALEPPPAQSADPTRPTTYNEWGQWIEIIAHESAHAWRLVNGERRFGKTAAERVRSGIQDEIETRKIESQVINELRNKYANLRPYKPTTGSFLPWAVERDIFPGEQRRSYLEHFVLGERLFEARKRLSAKHIEKYDDFVKEIDLGKRPLASYLAPAPQFINPRKGQLSTFAQLYPNLLLALRVIDARWRSVKDLDKRDIGETDPAKMHFYHDADLEKMREQHAKAFFDGIATYTKAP